MSIKAKVIISIHEIITTKESEDGEQILQINNKISTFLADSEDFHNLNKRIVEKSFIKKDYGPMLIKHTLESPLNFIIDKETYFVDNDIQIEVNEYEVYYPKNRDNLENIAKNYMLSLSDIEKEYKKREDIHEISNNEELEDLSSSSEIQISQSVESE